jgi:hypothetical protein
MVRNGNQVQQDLRQHRASQAMLKGCNRGLYHSRQRNLGLPVPSVDNRMLLERMPATQSHHPKIPWPQASMCLRLTTTHLTWVPMMTRSKILPWMMMTLTLKTFQTPNRWQQELCLMMPGVFMRVMQRFGCTGEIWMATRSLLSLINLDCILFRLFRAHVLMHYLLTFNFLMLACFPRHSIGSGRSSRFRCSTTSWRIIKSARHRVCTISTNCVGLPAHVSLLRHRCVGDVMDL